MRCPPPYRQPHNPRSRNTVMAAAATCVIFLAGCGTDHWSYVEVDWRKRLTDERLRDTINTTPPILRATEAAEASVIELPADGELSLSLEQAVVLTLQHNRGLTVEQINPMVSGTFIAWEQSRFDPRLFAESSISRDRSQQVSRATGGLFGDEGQTTNHRVGIAQELPTGTDVEFSAENRRAYSSRTPVQSDVRLGVTFTQALLQGASPAANLVRIRQARLDRIASEFELRGFTEALIAQVENAYWTYALRRREIDIFEQSLELAKQQAQDTSQRIEVGRIAETELAAAEAEVALREQALIVARGALERARLQLLRLMNPGGEIDWSRPITLTEAPGPIEPILDDVATHVGLAVLARPDLNEARLRLDQDRLEVIRTRNGLLPRLDLFMTLGRTGYAESFGPAVEDLSGKNYDLLVGVRFEQLLGNRRAESEHQRSLLVRRQAVESVRNLEQIVDLDVRLAYVDVTQATEQITAAAATRRLREETVRAEMEKFQVGMSTALLTAQAQRDLLESRIFEVESVVNLRRALTRLYHLDGSLLQRRGITIPETENYHPL